MIPKVRDWLEAQGFTLELRTASAFRGAGFQVRQSSHFVDSETGKFREIDVIATDPDVYGIVEITFVVECKASKKPWVLLCSPDSTAGYNRLFAFGALSEKAIEALSNHLEDLLPKLEWLRKDGLVGYSARQAFTEADAAYAAAVSVAKACDSWIHPPDADYAAPYTFAFPIIVVDSPMFQCSLAEDGTITLAEVDQGEFLFFGRFPRPFGTCIRVVSVSTLPSFAAEARATARLLRAGLRGEEERIRESWRAPRSK